MNRLHAAFLAALFSMGCAHSESVLPSPLAEDPAKLECSTFFCVDRSTVPPAFADPLLKNLRNVEEVLGNEAFLAAVRAKKNWTFLEPGLEEADIERSLREHMTPKANRILPTLVFYSPPLWGIDTCGGKNFWPQRTISTGCTVKTRDGRVIIKRNIQKHSIEGTDFMEFLVHEWMHAADFGHDGNAHQCSREKRNSVPIHVACLAVAYPDAERMKDCSLACHSSDEALPD